MLTSLIFPPFFLTPFGLNESDVEKMIQFCDIEYFQKGDVVIHEGSKNNFIYVLNKKNKQ